MTRFLLRRLGTAVFVLALILALDFALLHLPGAAHVTSETAFGREDATQLAERIGALEAEFGLDRPLHEQFVSWLAGVARLDFGVSMLDRRPVGEKIAGALAPTLLLQGAALAIMFGVGIPLGVLMATRRGKAADRVLGTTLYGLYSVPGFWLATLLLVYLATDAGVRLFPLEKLASRDAETWGAGARLLDTLHHLVLPVTVLAVPGLTAVARQTRHAMAEQLELPYVRTARAAGLSERRVVWRYALRNSLVPLATLFGALVPTLIGGSVVVERIFNVHGMGQLAWDATMQRDFNLLQALVLLTATLTLLGYLISDVLSAALDPRVRFA